MKHRHWKRGLMAWLVPATAAVSVTPEGLQSAYTAQADSSADARRGEQLFIAPQGREWRCATCHGALPTQPGRHAITGKPIAPLAPAFNPERLTDAAKTEKWFRRNCNDVLGRECSVAEKADVFAWLRSLK